VEIVRREDGDERLKMEDQKREEKAQREREREVGGGVSIYRILR